MAVEGDEATVQPALLRDDDGDTATSPSATASDDGDGGEGPSDEAASDDANRAGGEGEELATRFVPVDGSGLSLPVVMALFVGGLAAMAAAALWSNRRRRGVEPAPGHPVP